MRWGFLNWLDAGRSSVVAALALALVAPSVNVTVFDGLPLEGAWEFGALAALLPFVFSASLRDRLAQALRGRLAWGHRAVLAGAMLAILVKVLLLAFGSDRGFVGCYASTWRPPDTRCERSYSNLFQRHDGATRVDPELDFGPSGDQASNLVVTPSVTAYREGVSRTDWGFSFANDLRFNEAPGVALSLHQFMPFEARWTGRAAIPDDGEIQIRYAGQGKVEIGGTVVALPVSLVSRTVTAQVPPGDQQLDAEFAFAAVHGATLAEFRLLTQTGEPIPAAAPPFPEQVAAVLVWLLLAAAFAGLAAIALSALGSDLLLLGLVVIAAAIVEALSSPTEYEGFQYMAAALIPILIWRNPRRPLLLAYAALLTISTVGVLNAVSDLGAVLYKTSGTDFLTYESYAREVVLDHSLRGGSDVFFYQPGSRYVLGLMRVLSGDRDLLVTIWSMVGLSLPFVALISWNRRRVQSRQTLVAIAIAGFLLLAVLNSPTTLAFVALAASEAPSWALLPLAVAAPQLRPSQQIAWIGSAAAAALIWVMRNNQALAVGAILAAIAVGIGRSRRRLMATAASVALAIALLPALHNVVYGGQLKFSTTSVDRVRQIEPSDLGQTLSNTEIGSQIRGHIAAIFYDPPTAGLTVAEFGWLLWGLLAVWVAAIALALLRLLRDREFPPIRWLLLVLPIAYLIPHVVYQVEVYYPRHIIAGYLAMGVCAIGAFAEMGVGRRNPRA